METTCALKSRPARTTAYMPHCFRYIVTYPTKSSAPDSACPILFLPGLGGRAEHAWDIPERKVIAIDYPGSGDSVSEWGPVSSMAIAKMAWDLLDFLEIDTCEIVGFSFGGCVLQKMIAQAPKRVERASIINAHAGLSVSGIPLLPLGIIGIIVAMWSLFSLALAHRDMNAAWLLMDGFEHLPDERKRKVIERWEPVSAAQSTFTQARMWMQRRVGDGFHLLAYLTHYLWPREIAVIREFDRLRIFQSKDDPLINPRSGVYISAAFEAPLDYLDGNHMCIARPFAEVFPKGLGSP